MIKIQIKKRNRDYALFTWPKTSDFEILTLFGGPQEYLEVSVQGKEPKTKKISYKYRRFTLGKKVFDETGHAKYFILQKGRNHIKLSLE